VGARESVREDGRNDLPLCLLGVSLLYFVAVILVFTGVLFIPLMIEMSGASLSSPVVQEAAQKFLVLHTRVWSPILILIGLLVIHNIIISHRIAGPLFRIRNELKQIGDGNLFVQVKLRKNDYLDKEADSVNRMVDAIRGKVQGIEQNQRKASSVLVDLQRAMNHGSGDEMNNKIDQLNVTLEALRDNIDQFQIPRVSTRPPENKNNKDTQKMDQEPVGAGSAPAK
jgi:methyl-accepting chemotaxis protein